MSASADVLAMAKVEVDLNAIPEGKNVRFNIWSSHWNSTNAKITRSSSNGVESPFSFVTVPQMRSKKPKTSKLNRSEILKPMPTVSRSLNGWLWLVSN